MNVHIHSKLNMNRFYKYFANICLPVLAGVCPAGATASREAGVSLNYFARRTMKGRPCYVNQVNSNHNIIDRYPTNKYESNAIKIRGTILKYTKQNA